MVLDLPNGAAEAAGGEPRGRSASTTTGRSRRTTTAPRSPSARARVQESLGYTGAGIGVAVIDSGITSWHDDLTNKTVEAVPVRQPARRPSSWTSSTAARCRMTTTATARTSPASSPATATTRTARRRGIAPDANIISLKVLDAQRHRARSATSSRRSDWVATQRDDLQHPRRQHVGRRRRSTNPTGPTR